MSPKLYFPMLAAVLAVFAGVLFGPSQPAAQPIIQDVQVVDANTGPGYLPEPAEDEPDPVVIDHGSIDPVTGIRVEGPAVIMISAPWCGPCQKWKREGNPMTLRNLGWEFHEDTTQKHFEGVRVYPTFRIYQAKKWHQHNGPMTWTGMKSAINPSAKKVSASGWTRGQLLQHLYQGDRHRMAAGTLDSLTLDELEALHIADHSSQRPATVRSSGGCSTGNCGTARTVRGGLFSRRR